MDAQVRAFWNRLLGDRGERAAIQFLARKGIRLIKRGFRVREGEIDLIARDGDTLVFVEVKSRLTGSPAEAVDLEKQRRVCRAALRFLRRERLLGVRCRFDVVAVVWPGARGQPRVEHFPAAFEFAAD